MKFIKVIATMFLSFISLLFVISIFRIFGFSTNDFHDPAKIFSFETLVGVLAILLLPILLVIFSQRFLIKGSLAEIGLTRPFYSSFFSGTVLGVLIKAISILFSFLSLSQISIQFIPQGIGILNWSAYFLWFLTTLFLNSLSEELSYRSFPMQNFRGGSLPKNHLLIWFWSLLFSLMHFLFEPPEILPFLYRLGFGIVAGTLFLKERSLWQIVGFHTGWNFLALTVSDADWRTGALFKIEGLSEQTTLISNVMVLFSCYFLICLLFKKPLTRTPS